MNMFTVLRIGIISFFIFSSSLKAMQIPSSATFYSAFVISIDKYSESNNLTHLKNAQRSLSGLYQHYQNLEKTTTIDSFLNTKPKNLANNPIKITQLKKDVNRKYHKKYYKPKSLSESIK